MYKEYAEDLKNDIKNINNNRNNRLNEENRDGKRLRNHYETEWDRKQKQEIDYRKSQQQKYAKELDTQMTHNLLKKRDEFKMTKDVKAMNIGNLHAYKDNDE